MELVNHTPVPAQVHVGRRAGSEERLAVVVAKATFRLGARGAELCTQAPYPIFTEDRPTAHGLLPGDLVPRRDDGFELIVLGAAYPAQGATATERTVGLSVGSFAHELAVFGDRQWQRAPDGSLRISRPQPFARMPLGYAEAFGGRMAVLVDADSYWEVRDPFNPLGRGFDPEPQVAGLGQALGCPPGYPSYPTTRSLPNVEDPRALIRHPDDRPVPASWATVPFGTVVSTERFVRLPEKATFAELAALDWKPGVFHRAHPDLVIPRPAAGAPVCLTGVLPDDQVLAFELPRLGVEIDCAVGTAERTHSLAPHLLLVLPDEARAYLVYRHAFTFDPGEPGAERSMRLRLTESWADLEK
ncbi:MAG: DUF2169 domain-containing protein [Myxococcales bacterium]|nr:DUF2169 domain-containing protein [Myxococcales bacterium]